MALRTQSGKPTELFAPSDCSDWLDHAVLVLFNLTKLSRACGNAIIDTTKKTKAPAEPASNKDIAIDISISTADMIRKAAVENPACARAIMDAMAMVTNAMKKYLGKKNKLGREIRIKKTETTLMTTLLLVETGASAISLSSPKGKV